MSLRPYFSKHAAKCHGHSVPDVQCCIEPHWNCLWFLYEVVLLGLLTEVGWPGSQWQVNVHATIQTALYRDSTVGISVIYVKSSFS